MGNSAGTPRSRSKNRKQVRWKAADYASPPGKPQLVSETELTPDVVTIRWTPPRHDGGAPIKGYLVEHRRYGSPHWVRATPLLVSFPELTLSGLEPGWRYQFRVSAENAVGLSLPSELSELLTVTLQRSAIAAPRFTEELVDTTALENHKVEFLTHFLGQPTPKICWFKDGFEIFSSRRIRITTDNEQSVLTIHQSALSDEGEVKCTATNRAGHVSTKARLTLEAPPTIRLPRQYEDGLLFELGETIRLKVSVDGRPAPKISWIHNGETISNSERHEIEESEKYSSLKITEAKRWDRGEYQVKAVNKLGVDNSAFLVTVTDKPSPPGRARVVMTLGKSVTLSWSVPRDDGGCKIGNYIVEYYRIGWDVWLKAATCRQLSTILGDLIEGSEYKFRVKAESPYGVSDPSEETDVVFIPDPKRGIVQPPRSNSHSRIVEDNSEITTPKYKPRSRSSTGVRTNSDNSDAPKFCDDSSMPIRPQRKKVKSPALTPDVSPLPVRKKSPTLLNRNIFHQDQVAMTRELAYGSPGINAIETSAYDTKSPKETNSIVSVKKMDTTLHPNIVDKVNIPKMVVKPTINTHHIEGRRKNIMQTIESSTITLEQHLHAYQTDDPVGGSMFATENRCKSPSPSTLRAHSPITTFSSQVVTTSNSMLNSELITHSDSNENEKQKYDINYPKTPRKHTAISNSSEFMLLLLPDEEGRCGYDPSLVYNFFENSIPPPLSLSAPELGQEPELDMPLRMAVSSTELLHEKAMLRICEESRSESETDILNAEKSVVPKIQINSRDDQVIIGLDRKDSIKRKLSAGIINANQKLWEQRRHSLRNTADLPDLTEGCLRKIPGTVAEKRELFKARQRSESEEKEEEEFERVRERMAAERKVKPLLAKRKVEICEEEQWDAAEGEEESMDEKDEEEDESEDSSASEEEMETSSSDEKNRRQTEEPPLYELEEDEQIYRPGTVVSKKLSGPSQAFEILSKPHALPNPNFIPKPILKRRENYEVFPIETSFGIAPTDQRKHSQSSHSENANSGVDMKFFRRSPSPRPPTTDKPHVDGNYLNNPRVIPPRPMSPFGTAPARLHAPKRQNDEIKVVVDHYGDIVRDYGQKGGQQRMYLNTDELKAAAEKESEEDLREIERSIENLSRLDDADADLGEKSEQIVQYTGRRRKSFTEVSSELFKTVKKTFASALAAEPQEESSSPNLQEVTPTMQRRGSGQGLQKRRKSSSFNRFLEPPNPPKKSPSKSPTREENWSNLRAPPTLVNINGRRGSASMRRNSLTPAMAQVRHNSLTGASKTKTKMCEITTQTSHDDSSTAAQKELAAKAELKVRSYVDYLTDLAMFIVACWLYLFHNELLAIPVLFIMVYRQMKDEIKKKVRRWLGKRKNKRR